MLSLEEIRNVFFINNVAVSFCDKFNLSYFMLRQCNNKHKSAHFFLFENVFFYIKKKSKYRRKRQTHICMCDRNVIRLMVRINCVKPKPILTWLYKLTCLHSDTQTGTAIANMQFNCKVKTENIVSFCVAMINTNVNRYYIILSILLIV